MTGKRWDGSDWRRGEESLEHPCGLGNLFIFILTVCQKYIRLVYTITLANVFVKMSRLNAGYIGLGMWCQKNNIGLSKND